VLEMIEYPRGMTPFDIVWFGNDSISYSGSFFFVWVLGMYCIVTIFHAEGVLPQRCLPRPNPALFFEEV
jgi:hypothetical protein